MNRHLMRVLLALYPRAFRDRYGAELASVTDELISAGEVTPLLAAANLVWGAALEWGRALFCSRRAARAMAVAAIIAIAGSLFATSHTQPGGTQASAQAAASSGNRCVFWVAPADRGIFVAPVAVGRSAAGKPGQFSAVGVPRTGPVSGKLSRVKGPLPAGAAHQRLWLGARCPSLVVVSPAPPQWPARSAQEWILLRPSS